MYKKILYTRRYYIQEDTIYKKILYTRRYYIQEDTIYKKILYTRRYYIQEDTIYKKILYTRRYYIQEDTIYKKKPGIIKGKFAIYRGTGFKCEHVIIVNCDFSPCTQLLERNV